MKNQILLLASCSLVIIGLLSSFKSNEIESSKESKKYPAALVSYDDFKNLVTQVESHRSERLINLDTFLKMKEEENTIILDTRSVYRYYNKHIKGSINLPFTEFTHDNLRRLIPDTTTRILIYCNNNFTGDQINFASKRSRPTRTRPFNEKPIMLALNIPTYLNLYGYGYQNIFELHELVNVNDKRVKLVAQPIGKSPALKSKDKAIFKTKAKEKNTKK